jgi:hypothetical protein
MITFFPHPSRFVGTLASSSAMPSRAGSSCILMQKSSYLATKKVPPKPHAGLGRAMNQKWIGTVSVRLFIQSPTSLAPMRNPNWISVRWDRPFQMTLLPGGESPARAR